MLAAVGWTHVPVSFGKRKVGSETAKLGVSEEETIPLAVVTVLEMGMR